VALLSIESDTGKRQVKISGEAKDIESVLNYLRVLGAQPKLANVYLQSHQLQQQDPQHPVRFALGAAWVSVQ
jgi:Tfp pilus assembly protein PilN